MNYKRLGDLLAHYVRERALGGDGTAYTTSLWQDIEAQLQKFIQHLKEDGMDDMYSVNCKNSGWPLPDDPTETPRIVKSMGARIICTLMTKALYFLNGWSKAPGTDMEDDSVGNRELRNFIKCTIVHMFMHLLNESACASTWGIFYAWYSMEKMGALPNWSTNLVYTQACTQNLDVQLQVAGWSMKDAVKEWLKRNVNIQNTLNRHSFVQNCGLAVPKTKGSKQDGTDQVDEDTLQKIQNVGGNLQTAMRKAFRQIKKEWREQAIAAGVSNVAASPETESDDEAHDDADDDEEQDTNAGTDKDKKKEDSSNAPQVPKKVEAPPPPKVPEAPKQGVVPQDRVSVPKAAPDAQAPSVAQGGRSDTPPADAAPTTSAGTGQGTQTETTPPGPGPGPGPGQQPPPPPPPKDGPHKSGPQATTNEKTGEEKCKDSLGQGQPRSGSVVISAGCTSDTALGALPGVTDTSDSKPRKPDNGEKAESKADDSEQNSKGAVATGSGTEDQTTVTNKADPPASTGPTDPVSPAGAAGAGGAQGASGAAGNDGKTVDNGGNDVPPPLNPPKPKPNPNPDQAGSSPGGGSTTEDSSSPGSTGHQPPGSSGPGSTGHQNPGSSGPGSTGTGSTGTLQPGTTGDGSTGVPNPGSSGPGSQDTGQGAPSASTSPDGNDKTHKTADDPFGLDLNNPGSAVLGKVGGAFVEGIPPLVYHDTKGKGPNTDPHDNTISPFITPADILLSTPVLIFFASANEFGTSWNHTTGQGRNLGIRISRSLKGYEKTDIETLKQNNIVLREKLMGLTDAEYEELINRYNAWMNDTTRRLDAGDVSYRNFSKNCLDIKKYNNNSNSRCRNNSPRGSLKTKLKDMGHRDNVSKSNESLDLNYFGHDEEKEVHRFINYCSVQSPSNERDDISKDGEGVDTSTSCSSVESLFEGRNDISDDQEGINRMTESSTYRNRHRGSCIITAADIDEEVQYYIEKLRQRHELSGRHSGEFFENTSLGKMLRKLDLNVGPRGFSSYLRNKAQGEGTREKSKGFSLKCKTHMQTPGQNNKLPSSASRGCPKNTAHRDSYRKPNSKVGSEGLLPASQNKVQVEEVAKKPRRLFSAWTHTLLTREKLVTVTAAISAFNIIELYLYLILWEPFVCIIFLVAVASTIAIMLPVLLFRFCRRKISGMSNNILSE
ncbi:hypothetical protein AK88_02721 [Plasmodium fragile]|uniref:Schizont-infected cell agglutination extracellular alpha domain-containing protein n=1 Tax=Plasmodium fragile TaxID=5857 RepID=A0A0D9QKG7_PLAFR|nr:uncharacterized protein AK88_02721 [Plasmodium fragile]KJP87555.1 hypothetical protein AK88_02721 [Plasmodium fragile]